MLSSVTALAVPFNAVKKGGRPFLLPCLHCSKGNSAPPRYYTHAANIPCRNSRVIACCSPRENHGRPCASAPAAIATAVAPLLRPLPRPQGATPQPLILAGRALARRLPRPVLRLPPLPLPTSRQRFHRRAPRLEACRSRLFRRHSCRRWLHHETATLARTQRRRHFHHRCRHWHLHQHRPRAPRSTFRCTRRCHRVRCLGNCPPLVSGRGAWSRGFVSPTSPLAPTTTTDRTAHRAPTRVRVTGILRRGRKGQPCQVVCCRNYRAGEGGHGSASSRHKHWAERHRVPTALVCSLRENVVALVIQLYLQRRASLC